MTPEEFIRSLDDQNINATPIQGNPARRARTVILGNLAWLRQGRPRDMPAVLKQGVLQVCPHGNCLVEGWDFFCGNQRTGKTTADLIDRLTARYTPERVPYLDDCTACNQDGEAL